MRILMVALLILVSSTALAARHRIVVEAEKYDEIKASTIVDSGDTKASCGKCVVYPENAASGTKGDGGYVLYDITIPEDGNWLIWLRTNWSDGCGNSFFLIVDDRTPQIVGGDGTYNVWKWRKGRVAYPLTAGKHKVKVQNREDGAKLDQLLITNDARFMPTREM